MQIIKNIFARIWAFWGLIVFATSLLLMFPFFCLCFFWKEPKRSFVTHKLFRFWMAYYLPMIGIWTRVSGKEHFKKGEIYIVVCNHNSLMDVPVTTPRIPHPNKTIAKIEMSRIPLFGILYKLGSVLVDRKDKDSRKQSFAAMKEVLNMGLHMCIYPEGTRNKTGQPLKEFHDGAFKLAVDTQRKIIPAMLFGTASILPNNKTFYLVPGLIRFQFLEPVEPGTDAEILKQTLYRIMWEHYEKNN